MKLFWPSVLVLNSMFFFILGYFWDGLKENFSAISIYSIFSDYSHLKEVTPDLTSKPHSKNDVLLEQSAPRIKDVLNTRRKFINLTNYHATLEGYTKLGGIGEVEGNWTLKNKDSYYIDKSSEPKYTFKNFAESNLAELKNNITSSRTICFKDMRFCFEALAILNQETNFLDAEYRIWEVVKWEHNKLVAKFYDGCYIGSIEVYDDQNYKNSFAKVSALPAHKTHICHEGIKPRYWEYELTSGW